MSIGDEEKKKKRAPTYSRTGYAVNMGTFTALLTCPAPPPRGPSPPRPPHEGPPRWGPAPCCRPRAPRSAPNGLATGRRAEEPVPGGGTAAEHDAARPALSRRGEGRLLLRWEGATRTTHVQLVSCQPDEQIPSKDAPKSSSLKS